VAIKTKPVASQVSKDFQIERQIIGDLLAMIPQLNPNPPPFVPTKQFTSERQAKLVKDHDTGFLTTSEINVLVDMVTKQEKAFAWEDFEQGSLCPDFFPPVCIPTILHVLWVQHNCPIPPGLEKEVCEIICDKNSAGVYEPLNSTYCSQWFCVLKKNGKLRIVHSLELLNHVTIHHSGVPPFPDHVAESFAGRISNNLMKLTHIGVPFKYYLCQCISDNCKEITLNNKEARFSQPKLELYGLMYLIGVRNLIIKVDARYIKGMLQNPDIQPSASMNCWIVAILMFHFELVHVKGTFPGSDGLLQCPPQPGNPPADDSDSSMYEDWIDRLHGFIHQVQLPLLLLCQVSMASHRLPPLAEAAHFNVCQALFKAFGGDQSRWSTATYSVFCARRLAAICFENNFKAGDLVLMRNTRIEVTHNKKMKPHYLGPLVVISRNHGGAYIICELDGSVLHHPVAAFSLVPFFAREHITVPSDAFDIDTS
ncbi:hypothetical protein J132_07951, partial [Termitomyces sp. J132]